MEAQLETTIKDQRTRVRELVDKIDTDSIFRITILHDHERHLLAEFVWDNEPGNYTAFQAKEGRPVDIIELCRAAKKHL